MNNPETTPQLVKIECIAPDGLGFGEGGISVKEQMRQGILTAEAPKHVHEVLTNDPNSFKNVETDDDGCGDGRPWVKILRRVWRDGFKEVVEYKKSLLRAKVFGGGLVVASSMWRSLKRTPEHGQTVGQDRQFMARKLTEYGLTHGAHTDNHATGDKCGCGAIDNYPLITANAVKYRSQIIETLKALYGDSYADNAPAIDDVFATYAELSAEYFADASGKQAMEQILETDAVVKELYGHHVEETIVINDVEGTTLDQQYFTQRVKDMCTDKPQIVQAFVVDIWRGRQIAEAVANIAREEGVSDDKEYLHQVAYADFMIRTLAVAATLTAGDLPVYIRRHAK